MAYTQTPLLPYIVELKHDSQKHTDVLKYIMARVNQARARRQDRETRWTEAENVFTSYVKETDMDARRRVRKSEGAPQYTTITIPYAYATLMTAHTYWTSVFLARDPVLQVQGTNGESQMAEMSVEAMLQYFLISGKNLVPLFLWLLDQGKYGEGILGMSWDVEKCFIPEVVMGPRTLLGTNIPIPNTSKRYWKSREVTGYEGLRYFNVRPHDFLFDPTVTLQNFQQGEYAGHDSFVPMTVLQDNAALGKFYNVDYVKGIRSSKRAIANGRHGGSTETTLPSAEFPSSGASDAALGCDLTELTISLVPRALGLAPRDYVEKWTFTVANDSCIVSAQPQGWYHNEFMYDVLEHEMEGYNVSKRGMLEMLKPLNETLDWLINSHFFNVRKALNNEWIYDPSKLVSKDVESPGPGKLIRVRPEAYGTDVTKAFYQVQTGDITRAHIQDAMLIIEMMQRLTGVNDTVMGMMGSKRKTATEVRSSSSFAVNRLKTQCEYYGAMGFSPLTSRSIRVAQQMMQGRAARYFRIVGNAANLDPTQRFLQVGPDEIAGAFDFLPVDGTLPIDRQSQAAVFGQIMQQMGQMPQVAQQYDIGKLFGWMVQLMGVRNLERFRVQVLPPGMGPPPGTVPVGQGLPTPNITNNASGIPPGGPQ